MEGGDAHAGVKGRPAGTSTPLAAARPPRRVRAGTPHCSPRGWMSISLPHPPAFVAGNDATLFDECAATRVRIATDVAMSTVT